MADRGGLVALAMGLLAVLGLARAGLRGTETPADPAAPAAPPRVAGRAPPPETGPTADPGTAPATGSAADSPSDPPLDWLAFGGGSTPSGTQFAMEADLRLAAETFGGRGRVLFAGGADSLSVMVDEGARRGDPLLRDLADLMAPRAGRDARYRRPRLPGARPATRAAVLAALGGQLGFSEPSSLIVYAAAHGELGKTAAQNTVALWAGGAITPVDLAELLDRARTRRTVRLVLTSCFSGGFAEMIFAGADPRRGPAARVRCGLFAAPWDLESSGCDANADRRAHEGYARHFFSALRGRDRDGAPLPLGSVDLDGDGRISLLEAHTRTRIASMAADVPTTTSERWLRAVAPAEGPSRPLYLPEEEAVIAALAPRLRVPPRDEAIAALHRARQDAVREADAAMKRAQEREDRAWQTATAALLARWPVLDDPWHPDFSETISKHRDEIAMWLRTSEDRRTYLAAVAMTDAAGRLLDAARIAAALAERMERARVTRALAGRLQAAGGENLARFLALRRCEAAVPRLRGEPGPARSPVPLSPSRAERFVPPDAARGR